MTTMPFRTRIFLAVCSAMVLGAPHAASAACDQTLSVGASIASAVANAPNGSTICLNSGNYGAVSLSNITRTGFVIVQSTSGVGARLDDVSIGNSRFIRLTGLTLSEVMVNACSTSIEIWNSVFVPNALGLLYFYDTACTGITDMALIVDGVTFDRVQQLTYEGRLSIRGVRGITIRNSVFSGQPTSLQSDGVQIIGGSRDVTIGPGNVFNGMRQSLCGTIHCDAIQIYGGGPNTRIFGNRFENGDTFLMMPDGTSSVTVEDNIFDGAGSSYIDKIQFGSASNPIFRHNTLKSVRASFDSKSGNPATTNALVENNILVSGSSWKTSNGSGCSGCTFRFNLFDDAARATGTNNVIGTPAFTGGPSPATWAGWRLAAGSPGKNAGNDGRDMGTTYYGIDTPAIPAAPTNLVIVQ